MQSNLSFVLGTLALLSVSGAVADYVQVFYPPRPSNMPEPKPDQVEGSYGCSNDGYCWSSCSEPINDGIITLDETTPWKEGDDWCWLTKFNDETQSTEWVTCEDDCSRLHYYACDVTQDECEKS